MVRAEQENGRRVMAKKLLEWQPLQTINGDRPREDCLK